MHSPDINHPQNGRFGPQLLAGTSATKTAYGGRHLVEYSLSRDTLGLAYTFGNNVKNIMEKMIFGPKISPRCNVEWKLGGGCWLILLSLGPLSAEQLRPGGELGRKARIQSFTAGKKFRAQAMVIIHRPTPLSPEVSSALTLKVEGEICKFA